MERDSFIFYKEYKEAIEGLSNRQKLEFYESITDYVFYGKEPKDLTVPMSSVFIIIKRKLDKNNDNYWNYEDRRSSKYKKWKENCLKRDNYCCRQCGGKNNLVVHHIKHFADNKELRFEINNGITLCQKCHREVHKNER